MFAQAHATFDDPLPLARERFRAIQALDPAPLPDLRAAVRRLVVVGSSSRGGSSIFAELLRKSPRLVHFRAEVNPFLALADRTFPESGTGSDALGPVPDAVADAIARDLARDAGTPDDRLDGPEELWRYALDVAGRLTLQWPTEAFDPLRVHADVEAVLAELRREGWAEGHVPDADLLFARILVRVHAQHPVVDPRCYDLDRALVERLFPVLPPFAGPMSRVVEEPPFVVVRPWRRATAEDLARRPLMVKTPSNAYRFPFWRALFPHASIDVVHLTRNVAASVNGLYDGWRFPGFFSHELNVDLRIAGYSDAFPTWGHRWWKFDLPPGWQAWTERPLEEVCAFQWRSAHGALVDAAPDALRLRFEDVVGGPDARDRVFRALESFLDVPLDEPRAALSAGLPPVMATAPPRARRWFARAGLLGPVLRDPANRDLMERLGYAHDPDTWL